MAVDYYEGVAFLGAGIWRTRELRCAEDELLERRRAALCILNVIDDVTRECLAAIPGT